jgi:hypothetical protein
MRNVLRSLGLCLGPALLLVACGPTPVCHPAPTRAIVGFVVTTTTGSDSTNANIYFCVMRKSAGTADCFLLDDIAADDFEQHEVNTFKPSLMSPIAAGDLSGFTIENRGGGFLDNSWGMAALRVAAVLDDGSRALLYEVSGVDLDAGDAHDSSKCSY